MRTTPMAHHHLEQPQRQRGETLMGLLVGLAVGLWVLAGGSVLLANQLRGHRMALQDSHLQHDLRSAMDWISRELGQAHYNAKAWQTRSPVRCADDFCSELADLLVNVNRW